MRPTTIGALLAFALASLVPVPALAAQQPTTPLSPPPSLPVVEASGYGEARVTPDRATVSVGVETRATTAAAASAENARLQRGVVDTLRALGIPANLIGTVGYSLYPEQVFNPERGDRRPRITGYIARNTVQVEVRRLDQVGPVIDAAIAKGANGVSGLQFSASNTDEARRQALASAVAQAQGDAAAIARAAGGCVGDAMELTTVQFRPPVPMGRAMAMQADATPIEPGEQTLTVSIMGRWRLQGSCP